MKQLYETEDMGRLIMNCYECEKIIWPWQANKWDIHQPTQMFCKWEVSHKRCDNITSPKLNEGKKKG